MEQPVSVQVHVHRDTEATALAAARRVIELGRRAIDRRGRFCAALAGGTTPMRMYELLAEPSRLGEPRTSIGEAPRDRSQPSKHECRKPEPDDPLDWKRVHVFFTDERCVPPDHSASNYARVRRCLLDRIALPDDQVHRIESGSAPFELAAERYDAALRSFFCVPDARPPVEPTFDLVLLGVGEDGHTASLFPGSRAVAEARRWAVHTQAPDGVEPRDRITLTLPVINSARRVMFLATGVNKSRVVCALISGQGHPSWPAAKVRCGGGVEWHVDEAAAGLAGSFQEHRSNP